MRNCGFTKRKVKKVIVAALIFAAMITQTAYCQPSISMMIQQTPVNGGEVTPNAGIHSFSEGQQITLTAVPKPGYRFVYWVGNVEDPTANRTITNADSPQIIIAVFERDEYASVSLKEYQLYWVPNPSMISSPVESPSTGAGEGAKRPSSGGSGDGTPKEDEFPVPEPIPEPATILLMGIGSLIAAATRRNKERSHKSIVS